MSAYGWLIEDDYISNESEASSAGKMGPHGITTLQINQLKLGQGERFRIYDGDGVMYYAGRIIGEHDGFEPLDDYGTPNDGATSIYYEGPRGVWREL